MRYTTDVRLPGQLEGRILRSPHAHATVVSIDASAAQVMPGVKAIIELLEPDRIVRYVCDAVVALAAC